VYVCVYVGRCGGVYVCMYVCRCVCILVSIMNIDCYLGLLY
jgi:hypothetical protein